MRIRNISPAPTYSSLSVRLSFFLHFRLYMLTPDKVCTHRNVTELVNNLLHLLCKEIALSAHMQKDPPNMGLGDV